VNLQPLLDAVLVDLGGTVVVEAPPGTPTADLRVELRPDALADLQHLAQQVHLGAVTNTAVMDESEVRALLAESGVAPLLEVLVTSVDAGAAKPDPAALDLARQRLGLGDPARVLYVGDQPTDATAAAAAGMAYADVAGGTIAAAIDAWIERTAGSQFEAARGAVGPTSAVAFAEAAAAFGDARLYLERFVSRGRHVEVMENASDKKQHVYRTWLLGGLRGLGRRPGRCHQKKSKH
jgi:FMN phosphatase YigB (HAD superfamily)